ncbi:MAG: Holliday junction resolvase RuvX [Candidatus Saccharimonadales bacterium]
MKETNIIALDIGRRRIGVALANSLNGFPSPLMTLENNENFIRSLEELIEKESVSEIVVGLPISLSGNETEQTKYTRQLSEKIAKSTELPVHFQDEAMTSKKAEQELIKSKKSRQYGIDALAATYILEDYLARRRAA